MKACYGLVEQAEKNGLDCFRLLGKGERKEISTMGEVCSLLREYVGSDGKFSPIVKYVEMGINDPVLKDLEIVDTPGLNDPIRSRSEETCKFMAQCDAVFLLSRASQFLTNDDMQLLRRTLLDNGIRHVSVIATQMDLGAQNEVGKTRSYTEALRRTLSTVLNTAKRNQVQQTPIPVSSLFENLACKMEAGRPLGPDERQVLEKNLPRFTGHVPATVSDFRDLSGMQRVRRELARYREDKDRIIEQHLKDRAREARRNFIEILTSLAKAVDTASRILEEHDMGSLKALRAGLLELMDTAALPISDVFSGIENEVGQNFADLKNRISANAKSFEDLEVDVSTHTEDRHHTTGMWWWKKEHTTVQRAPEKFAVRLPRKADEPREDWRSAGYIPFQFLCECFFAAPAAWNSLQRERVARQEGQLTEDLILNDADREPEKLLTGLRAKCRRSLVALDGWRARYASSVKEIGEMAAALDTRIVALSRVHPLTGMAAQQ